jgi:antitoxin (DNA-binding transcriptional repressor) of toxin-antitoxin stability system
MAVTMSNGKTRMANGQRRVEVGQNIHLVDVGNPVALENRVVTYVQKTNRNEPCWNCCDRCNA